jgi:hypothetical protein
MQIALLARNKRQKPLVIVACKAILNRDIFSRNITQITEMLMECIEDLQWAGRPRDKTAKRGSFLGCCASANGRTQQQRL